METDAEFLARTRAMCADREGPFNKTREYERKDRQKRWEGMNRHERRTAQALARRQK